MGFIYTANMPVASHFPSDDQGPMNQNFQYLNAFGPRDHQFTGNSGNANDGIHKQVTLAAQATPGFTGGTAVMYGNTANGATQLFFNNALVDAQLTTAVAGVPAITAGPPATGVNFLPGGILIQYGFSPSNIVTFPVAFKPAGIGPFITFSPTGTTGSGAPIVSVASNTGFTATLVSGMYWMAIGQAT